MTKLPLKLKKLHNGEYTALISRNLYDTSVDTLYIATYVNGFCFTTISKEVTTTEFNLTLQELEEYMFVVAPISKWLGV